MTARQNTVGPAGPTGPTGPRGAQGPIGGLVLTTPPAFAFGRDIGTYAVTGGHSTFNFVTTADINAGETAFIVVGWDPQVTPLATAVTSVVDANAIGTWSVDMTNDNTAQSPSQGPSYVSVICGQVPSTILSGSSVTITFDHLASDVSAQGFTMIGTFYPGASKLAAQAGADSTTSNTSLTSGSVTTVDTLEFVLSAWRTRGGTPTTFTPVAGWTKTTTSPTVPAAGGCGVDVAYKIAAAGAQSPTATTNSSNTWTNVIGRYQQGVAWTTIPQVINEKIWVTDPSYGARGDGVTDDSTAINAAIAAAVGVSPSLGGGVVAFPPKRTYMISKPIEQLGRAKIEGFEARDTIIKAMPSYAHYQMFRNWTTADWNSGIGESEGRTPPTDPKHSGHGLVLYPQLSGLTFHAGATNNISIIAWVGAQEGSYFKDLQLISGINTQGNNGIWGFDIRSGSSNSGFNYGRIEDCVLYSDGWERQVSLDSSQNSGSDFQLERIVFSPANNYHSIVFVQQVWGVHMHNCHWESPNQSSAIATIVLVSASGFAMTDCSCSVSGAHQQPFLSHTRAGGIAHIETPADIKGQHFFYTGSQASADTSWPGGFITDLWNTIPGNGLVDDHSVTSHGIHLIHHYTGKKLFWTDNYEQVMEKTF